MHLRQFQHANRLLRTSAAASGFPHAPHVPYFGVIRPSADHFFVALFDAFGQVGGSESFRIGPFVGRAGLPQLQGTVLFRPIFGVGRCRESINIEIVPIVDAVSFEVYRPGVLIFGSEFPDQSGRQLLTLLSFKGFVFLPQLIEARHRVADQPLIDGSQVDHIFLRFGICQIGLPKQMILNAKAGVFHCQFVRLVGILSQQGLFQRLASGVTNAGADVQQPQFHTSGAHWDIRRRFHRLSLHVHSQRRFKNVFEFDLTLLPPDVIDTVVYQRSFLFPNARRLGKEYLSDR
mmetsp:Transcript_41796/g.64385  ORF Transcript_41796/g.64385 Transcript_41796/m.64385 type:complete len:290 (+) Transcript_41796:40-909(+)